MRLLVLTLMVVTGCHPMDPGAPVDGGVGDGGPALLSCSAPAGPIWITSKFGLLPSDQGVDQVGDGQVHNLLGTLAPFVNDYWSTFTTNGSAIFLLDLPGLSFPPPDEVNFPFFFFVGIDVDDPPDPTNNLDGSGKFFVAAEQFDVSCNPTSHFENTMLSSGMLTASSHQVDIIAQAIGDFQSADDVIHATISPDGSKLDGLLAGVATLCAMSKLSSPVAGAGNFTLLDTIVNTFMLQPDIDRDHDGLDRVVGDGEKVSACIKSDGTVITGHSCPCDPRMRDGYSDGFFFEAVPAQIVGIAQNN